MLQRSRGRGRSDYRCGRTGAANPTRRVVARRVPLARRLPRPARGLRERRLLALGLLRLRACLHVGFLLPTLPELGEVRFAEGIDLLKNGEHPGADGHACLILPLRILGGVSAPLPRVRLYHSGTRLRALNEAPRRVDKMVPSGAPLTSHA